MTLLWSATLAIFGCGRGSRLEAALSRGRTSEAVITCALVWRGGTLGVHQGGGRAAPDKVAECHLHEAHVLADVAANVTSSGITPTRWRSSGRSSGTSGSHPGYGWCCTQSKPAPHAAVGEVTVCRRHVELAEQAWQTSRDQAGWVSRLARPAQLAAITGHALATVAHHTGDRADLDDAVERLTAAVDGFDPVGHARPKALWQARLAGLHLHAGNLDHAGQHTRQALDAVAGVRSARLIHALAQLRTSIAEHPDHTELQTLVDEIDAGIGAPPVEGWPCVAGCGASG